jgi:hypothetical protein
MAQVETARRTVAGKDYFAHRFILFSTLLFSAGEANPDRPPQHKGCGPRKSARHRCPEAGNNRFRPELNTHKLTKKRVCDLKKLPNIVFFYTFVRENRLPL